jgi:hypothetical protein
MVYAILGEVGFGSAGPRDTLLAYLQSISEATWSLQVEPKNALSTHPRRPNTVLIRHRYTSQAQRDSVFTNMSAQITARSPTAGSWIAKHDCSHDQPQPSACVEFGRVTF